VKADDTLDEVVRQRIEVLRAEGKYKREVVIAGRQGAQIQSDAGPLINFCANNYLGLADHPLVLAAARSALTARGAGMASVRFICGTQDEHRALERDVADFLGYEEAILFGSAFDANIGLFEAFTTADDVILSDALNHASIIDGVRLSRARRVVYKHSDLDDLRRQLDTTSDARLRVIATDGVFSMEGELAPLPDIVALAEEYDALVMVDDSHGVGVVGARGRGTVDHVGSTRGVAIQTGTFGKALGGAAGGYVVGPGPLIDLLRQQSRPYLFSNAMPPPVVAAARAALGLLADDPALVGTLRANVESFRSAMAATGLRVLPGEHPIVAVMIGDENDAVALAGRIREAGVMVVAFTHPVVPAGEARIRVQVSAAHTAEDLARAVDAFGSAARSLGLV
jgi:glycine C-acetyltransferase